jgi:hypothetical protein
MTSGIQKVIRGGARASITAAWSRKLVSRREILAPAAGESAFDPLILGFILVQSQVRFKATGVLFFGAAPALRIRRLLEFASNRALQLPA